jgi:hypothetical protein
LPSFNINNIRRRLPNWDELFRGVRSFHVKRAYVDSPKQKLRKPAQILYYRAVSPSLVEIVRVLHEYMEPNRRLKISCPVQQFRGELACGPCLVRS